MAEKRKGRQNYKTLLIRHDQWKRLKRLAVERETTMIAVIQEMLDKEESDGGHDEKFLD